MYVWYIRSIQTASPLLLYNKDIALGITGLFPDETFNTYKPTRAETDLTD